MATNNNLFPPLVPDAQPAFLKTSGCKFYFALSNYNNKEDIKNVQISLVDQKTNQSAFDPSEHPTGIKIATLSSEEEDLIKDDYKYSVSISPTDVGGFNNNQFYIVQLRFTSNEASDLPQNGKAIDSWLFNNKEYFSEWSTICLIRAIDQPQIFISNLNNDNSIKELPTPLSEISGRLYYEDDSSETEYLKSYNLNIYETSLGSKNSTYKTQQIYANEYNFNEFYQEIPYDFKKNVNYTLAFTYITNNLYTNTVLYKFKISEEYENKLDGVITIVPEEKDGRIKLDIDFEHTIKTNNDIIIKRASSKTNFKIWETVKTIPHTIESLRNVWYDTSIESGIWYKYRFYSKNDYGLDKFVQTDQPVICTFEDIFLTNEDKQLKIQFNPSISDFKYNTIDSQQVTLGAKYPFVKRNGNSFFRTFSIGGLISSFMDNEDWHNPEYYEGHFYTKNKTEPFTSSFELYNESKNLYSNYNINNNVLQYDDYVYEREFRKKVSDFLYENNIKLFRSLTEGNILVKLQNIAFQPIDSLGRRLYSFSATAVQIDDSIINNFNKYNIINKYYYTYKIETLQNIYFNSKDSLISNYFFNTSSLFSKYNSKLLRLFRLDVKLQQTKDAIIYIKIAGNQKPIKYETQQGILQLSFDEKERFIEDCYFYGIHLNENQYSITNKYYYETKDVKNPVNNNVYYIYKNEETYKINNYIQYNRRQRLLKTESEETQYHLEKQPYYTLFTDGDYQKYIYYNNTWYPFSDQGDVLMKIKATISYYYEIKENN